MTKHQAPTWSSMTGSWKLGLVTAIGLALAIAIITHQDGITGSWYWRWPWRELSTISASRWYFGMTIASLPIIAAMAIELFGNQTRAMRIILLVLLSIGVTTTKLASLAILSKPIGLAAMNDVVRNSSTTSYYTDAAALLHTDEPHWLATYPEFLPIASLHTQSKPPGAVAFYRAFIRAFGYGDRSATAGGIALAILAALSIPATYALVHLLTQNERAAVCAAILLSLCPGFELIFPTFDATYPILAFALIGTWHLALSRNSWRFAVAFGLVFALTCFITYNLLVLGAFLLGWAIVTTRAATIARAAIIALAAFGIAYVLVWIFTGFDPIATFRSAWTNQHRLLAQHAAERPYPATISFDLLDFGFGAGWLIVPLALFGLFSARDPKTRTLMIACLAQPLVVAITGMLQSETARAWNFMLPLLILPAAIELSRWPKQRAAIVYALMLAIVLVIGRHVVFMAV